MVRRTERCGRRTFPPRARARLSPPPASAASQVKELLRPAGCDDGGAGGAGGGGSAPAPELEAIDSYGWRPLHLASRYLRPGVVGAPRSFRGGAKCCGGYAAVVLTPRRASRRR